MGLADWILKQHAKNKFRLTHADFVEEKMEEEIRLNKRVEINDNLTDEQVTENFNVVLKLLELNQKKQEIDNGNILENTSFYKERQSLLERINETTTLSKDKDLKRKVLQL